MERKHDTPHWFPLKWTKRIQPLLCPEPELFVSRNIYEPSVLFDGRTHVILFRGESAKEPPTGCVGRLGIGFSSNGVDFQCRSEPALAPDSPYEAYGLAHPRLALVGGVFLLTYAAFDGARYRLCLATSIDLKAWFRHGPLFPEFEGNEGNTYSGSVMPQYSEDGRYFMFVGAGDLWLASSTDLVNWELNSKPTLKREDCPDFAAQSIQPGPSPFLTKDGVVIVLNATDKRNYTKVFAALLDGKDPSQCLAHLKQPFLVPEHDWEMFGYLPQVVRATGLTLIDDQFNLYYSGADRCIGMATAPVPAEFLPVPAIESEEPEASVETVAQGKGNSNNSNNSNHSNHSNKKNKKKKSRSGGEERQKICGV